MQRGEGSMAKRVRWMLMGGKADPYREARTRLSSAARDMTRWTEGKDGGGVRGSRERQQWRGRSVSQ